MGKLKGNIIAIEWQTIGRIHFWREKNTSDFSRVQAKRQKQSGAGNRYVKNKVIGARKKQGFLLAWYKIKFLREKLAL